MKRCIRNNKLVNNYGFLASWRRSSVGLIGSIGRRADAEAVVARSGTVRRPGTRTQFSTPLQRTEWTRIVKRVGRVSGTRALGDLEVSGAVRCSAVRCGAVRICVAARYVPGATLGAMAEATDTVFGVLSESGRRYCRCG